jgi:hypothetical protein
MLYLVLGSSSAQAQTNRTPLVRAFLQGNLDANGLAITNIGMPGVTNRQPFWLQGGLGPVLMEALGTNILQIAWKAEPAGLIFYWGDETKAAQSFRVGAADSGHPDPRITFAFLGNSGDETLQTYSMHTNTFELKFNGGHVANWLSWTNTSSDITVGDTNGVHFVRGTNVAVLISNNGAEAARWYHDKTLTLQADLTNKAGRIFLDEAKGVYGFNSRDNGYKSLVQSDADGNTLVGDPGASGGVLLRQRMVVGASGTPLSSIYQNSASLDFPNTKARTSSDLTVTVTGATIGDAVSIGTPPVAVHANSSYSAWVSSANTVTVRFNNYSSRAINPVSGTFQAMVTHF